MWRGLIFFLKLAVLVAVAVWLAERPGDVTITWQGYRLDTTFGMLLLAILILCAAAVIGYRVWRNVTRAPVEVGRLFRGRRHARGYQALTQGMVAVAAGEPEEARRFARKADGLLDNPPLTHLLSAQAAQLNGEDGVAREHFRAMLEDPETKFLGLRGLFRQAQREGDLQEALAFVRQARDIRPETPWVLTALFDLGVKTGDLDTAIEAVRDMQRYNRLTKAEAKRRRAVLLTQKAQKAEAAGQTDAARDAAKSACELAPDLPPAARLWAEMQLAAGDRRRAARTLENAWAAQPHPDLVEPYLRARKTETAAARYRHLHKMTDRNPGHRESELALARTAMEASLWGEARKHLTKAGGDRPSESICRLMSTLAERESGDQETARAWLLKAAEAPPDPAWVCNGCGAVAAAWHATCPNCDAFDSFAWRAPQRPLDALGQPATQAHIEPKDSPAATPSDGATTGAGVPDAEVETARETSDQGTASTGAAPEAARTGT
jgi:HemY protein